ncbi:MAG: CooT family nickel-binding protein [Syntrophaceae bacterium]|nr:CooT family nickel-binding protein [Syntrophaceae bacterium]
MCEFAVYLEKNGTEGREMVARKIIKAKRKDGRTVLMDASGSVTSVEHVTIEVVDTLMQELTLRKERDE